MSGQTRKKGTKIETTLPPAAELVVERPYTLVNRVDLDGAATQIDYRELCPADPHVNPMPIDREGYGSVDSTHHHWATGHVDWLNVKSAIERFGVEGALDGDARMRLLDFGCASGRFLRHVWAFGRETIDPWGCDFAPANIDWGKRYLTDEIKFVLNTTTPHLPFNDGYFDVITAFSVFTHIDKFEDAWLLELRRIVSPGGILYLTTQNNASWEVMLDRPWNFKHQLLANNYEGNLHVDEALFSAPMPEPRIVFKMSNAENYSCNTWVSNDYIVEKWGRYFDVLHIANLAHSRFQSPVILRRKG